MGNYVIVEVYQTVNPPDTCCVTNVWPYLDKPPFIIPKKKIDREGGPGPPISVSITSTEVASVLPRYPTTSVEGSESPTGGPNPRIDQGLRVRIPNRFKGWGCQSETTTPPSRLSASSVQVNSFVLQTTIILI
ncbi:hypothetical protein CRG98_035858 [Punica granatum]|uniref:Uncharacterized protein n=1 Tax=Punica granatum TaxID=22663 RepID=A0A2I0IIC5_PUNGR|nr:hypothetical protein CRG98_035858 [Punica granatum]